MFKDFRLGQYIPGNSLLHRLDPRTKLWGFSLLTLGVFLAGRWESLIGLALLIGLIVFSIKIPIRHFLSSLKALWPVLLLTLLINGVNATGESLAKIGPINFSLAGLWLGLLMVFRLVLVVVLTSVFTFTTSPISLSDGLERLFKPLTKVGFPAQEIALMMSIAIRFIPTIMEEGDRLVKAVQARGGDLGNGGLIKRAKGLMPLLIPLFIGTFRRADELAEAMEVRCYRGGSSRTRYRELELTGVDYVSLGIVTLAFVVLLVTR